MFTGIVEEVGKIGRIEKRTMTFVAKAVLNDLHQGDSIAVDGVCLTAERVDKNSFIATLSPESLSRTTLGTARAGMPVNLERAARLNDRMGGHLVQGHVDGVGKIIACKKQGGSEWVTFQIPKELLRYVVEKGSVTVDGVSLTVAKVEKNGFSVALIPETLKRTTLGQKKIGDGVNIEIDVIAKYVEKLVAIPASGVLINQGPTGRRTREKE